MASAKVLTRLRKLLALACSGNLHEASSARSKADEYMARHGLTEADAAVEGEDEVVQEPIGAAGFESPWRFKLATVAARHHGCEALGLRVGRRRKVRLVGVRARVTEAVTFFKLLYQEVLGLVGTEHLRVLKVFERSSPRTAWRLAREYLQRFVEGVVDGIEASLVRQKRGVGRGDSPSSDGLGVGGAVGCPAPQVEGLVRVEARGGGPGVRERLVSSGVREVSGEGDDRGDFDVMDEVAYWEGFRQAVEVQITGEREKSGA